MNYSRDNLEIYPNPIFDSQFSKHKFENPPRSQLHLLLFLRPRVRVLSRRQPSFKNLRANEVKRNRDINVAEISSVTASLFETPVKYIPDFCEWVVR